jgi:lactobin A/cerein 7B family class IIb bacteriocin
MVTQELTLEPLGLSALNDIELAEIDGGIGPFLAGFLVGAAFGTGVVVGVAIVVGVVYMLS